ncbi:MAG: hypothetical protein QM775_15990 [Pirellulales bacterium]
MTRKFLHRGWKLTFAAVVAFGVTGAGRADAGQCHAQGGGGFGGGNVGVPVGVGTPQVPRIPGLPQLTAGSNFPITVEAAVAKQATPVKILGNAPIASKAEATPIVVVKPAQETPAKNVSALSTVADALARR